MGLRTEAELFHTTSALCSMLSSAPSFHTGTAAIVKYLQYLSCIPFRQHLLSEALPIPCLIPLPCQRLVVPRTNLCHNAF